MAVCSTIGLAVLQLGGVDPAPDADRWVVAAWAGACVCGSALLVASVFVPLRGPVVTIVLAALSLGALAWPGVRSDWIRLARRRPVAPLVLLFVVAAIFSRRVDLFDTGAYHAGVVEWLIRFGTVRGLGLVHSRFGFGSSWFGLASAFNDGFLHARTLAVPGALAVFLGVTHLGVAGRRVLAGGAGPVDLFLVVGLAIVLIAAPDDLMISPSPDLAAGLLIVEAAWLLLRRAEGRGLVTGAVLLASGAAAVKLQAVPFALCIGALAVAATRSWRLLLGWAVLGAVLIAPTMTYNTITTGCPLFPSPPCVDTPSSLPRVQVDRLRGVIQDFGRGTLETSAEGAGGISWVWTHWLRPQGRMTSVVAAAGGAIALVVVAEIVRRRTHVVPGPLIGIVTGVLAVGLLSRRLGSVVLCAAVALAALSAWKARLPGLRSVAVTALVGLVIVLWYGPLLRFGFGYVGIAFAAFAASHIRIDALVVPSLHRRLKRFRIGAIALVAVATLVFTPGFGRGLLLRGPAQLALPPPVDRPAVATKQAAGFDYRVPVTGGQCWAAPLPCAPSGIAANRRLREPSEGIGGGFVVLRAR